MTARVRKLAVFFMGGAIVGGAVAALVAFTVASARTTAFADGIIALLDERCWPYVIDGTPVNVGDDLREIPSLRRGGQTWLHADTSATLTVAQVGGFPSCEIGPGNYNWNAGSVDQIWAALRIDVNQYLSPEGSPEISELDVSPGRHWLARTNANPSLFVIWGEGNREETFVFANITVGRAQFPEEPS